jgi:hypothetical protein
LSNTSPGRTRHAVKPASGTPAAGIEHVHLHEMTLSETATRNNLT